MNSEKFKNQRTTAKGEERAFVDLKELKTLWFNTGTQCNLSCENCYIESSPHNDRLSYISIDDVTQILDEIESKNYPVKRVGLTGGEPFMNPDIIKIIDAVLSRGFEVLVLTNALNPIDKHFKDVVTLNEKFGTKLELRISLDHYTREVHEKERGLKTFDRSLKRMKALAEEGIFLAIAGRSLVEEDQSLVFEGYKNLMIEYRIPLNVTKENLVIFPEMEHEKDVPEISVGCWDILSASPDDQMCAHERMVVKRKGNNQVTVLPCTLLAYDQQFDLGHSLEESSQRVYLNHEYCAKFCVLGGSSCSST